ncbi:hypothetical protein LZ31DRAFT_484822, partial [Colletotrichum somersetense]
FLIKKKDNALYLINLYIKLNKVIIYNTYIPFNTNEFKKDFSIYKLLSLLDFFSRYN